MFVCNIAYIHIDTVYLNELESDLLLGHPEELKKHMADLADQLKIALSDKANLSSEVETLRGRAIQLRDEYNAQTAQL